MAAALQLDNRLKTLLVVDDEKMTLKIVERVLRGRYEVICTDSGKKALELIRSRKPDLVIADINMPEMTGFELVSEIESLKVGALPIVFLTAEKSNTIESRSFAMGVKDYIRKPFSADVLLKRIEHVLESSASEQKAYPEHDADALTGLPDRASFEKGVEHLLSAHPGGTFLMMDLDHFKAVNDMLGHKTGDRVLCAFSTVLKSNVRETDLVSRLGGDEFVVYFPYYLRSENILDRCSRIQQQTDASFREVLGSSAEMLSLSVSIGIARSPSDGTTVGELYQNADRALYYVKRTQKGTCHIFDRRLNLVEDAAENGTPTLGTLENFANQLQESRQSPGAYYASYTVFRDLYQLMLRRNERKKIQAQLILFTLQAETNDPQASVDEETITSFCVMCNHCLRRGDVTIRYGQNQQITLLNDCPSEDSPLVAERILRTWKETQNKCRVTYEIREFPL